MAARFLERFSYKIMAAANNFLRFAVAILFVYIGSREFRAVFKRHPMEPGIKAEVPHSRDRRKKMAKCARSDQIHRDCRIKSQGVSLA